MIQEREYTISVWGGWNHTTLTSYLVRGSDEQQALNRAKALFRIQYGTDRIDSAWILRSTPVGIEEELA